MEFLLIEILLLEKYFCKVNLFIFIELFCVFDVKRFVFFFCSVLLFELVCFCWCVCLFMVCFCMVGFCCVLLLKDEDCFIIVCMLFWGLELIFLGRLFLWGIFDCDVLLNCEFLIFLNLCVLNMVILFLEVKWMFLGVRGLILGFLFEI